MDISMASKQHSDRSRELRSAISLLTDKIKVYKNMSMEVHGKSRCYNWCCHGLCEKAADMRRERRVLAKELSELKERWKLEAKVRAAGDCFAMSRGLPGDVICMIAEHALRVE